MWAITQHIARFDCMISIVCVNDALSIARDKMSKRARMIKNNINMEYSSSSSNNNNISKNNNKEPILERAIRKQNCAKRD